jgi:site-specific recombinase XerD
MGGRMTKIRLKYIKEYAVAGETYRYFRRKGCLPIKLPGLPGSRDFNAAYEAALNEKPIPPSAHSTGTLGRLIAEYYTSVEYANLKPSTRTTYRIVLDPLSRQHGHRLVRDMGRENARKIIEAIGATRPGMANLVRSILKRVLRYAVDRGWRNDNPAAGIAPYKIGTRHTWTDEQLDKFEKRWPIGTRERLDYATLLYSGQRGGDVVKMARPSPKATTIRVVQEKTGTELVIPIHPEWRRVINATPAKGLSLLGDTKGRPIKRATLTLRINVAVAKAKLPVECKAHGLRKALSRRLAERGASSKQIAGMTGHKTLKEIERYTDAADQQMLATQAMKRIK